MPRIISTVPAALLLAALPVFGDGVPPHAASADYPAHQNTKDFELGAGLLSAEQVKKILPEKIRQKYVVVEVALYPKPGASVDVRTFDFSLVILDWQAHPETPEEVSSVWRERDPKLPGGVRVGGETGVIYESGRDANGQRRSGVGTYESVGVSTGDDPRRPPPPDPRASPRGRDVEMKVRDVALPEGDTTRPVAGYLFFPAPKKRGGQIQLKYFRDGIDVVLVLPQPK